jgi:hypothetical protein
MSSRPYYPQIIDDDASSDSLSSDLWNQQLSLSRPHRHAAVGRKYASARLAEGASPGELNPPVPPKRVSICFQCS